MRARRIGCTDQLGCNVVEDPVDVHDLHATLQRLLGIDHVTSGAWQPRVEVGPIAKMNLADRAADDAI